MKHPYVAANNCGCARCVRERERRRQQSESNPWKVTKKRSKRQPGKRFGGHSKKEVRRGEQGNGNPDERLVD